MNAISGIDTPHAPTFQNFQEEELKLGDVLAESKWLILLVSVLVLLGGVAYLWIVTPQYQANALIQVEEQQNPNNETLSNILSPMPMEETPVSAQLGILKARLVLGKVVDNLRLTTDAQPVYFPVIGSAIARHYKVAAGFSEPWFGLQQYAWGGEAIQVQTFDVPSAYIGKRFILEAGTGRRYRLWGPETLSGDVPLILEGEVGRPAQAKLGSESLTLFVSELKARPGTHFSLVHNNPFSTIDNLGMMLKLEEEGKSSGLIRIQLESSEPAKASTILNEVANVYLRQNVERKSAEAAKTLSFLEQQLPILKKDVEASEAALNTYRLKQGSIDLPKEIDAILSRVVDIEGQLFQLKQQRESLLLRLTSVHPEVIELDTKAASLDKELNQLNQQIKTFPSTQQKLIGLTRDVEVNTTLYTALLNKAQELQVAKAGTLGNVRIIDYAFPPLEPISPNKNRVLTLSLALGIFLGFVAAFLRGFLWKGVEDPDQLEKQLGFPVYTPLLYSPQQGRLSKQLRTSTKQPLLLASRYPKDPTVEGLRSLRTTLHFVLMDAKNNVITIIGPSPKVGKTFTTANLGVVLASIGKRVLLIDTDLRKGQLHRYFGLGRDPGLSGLISGASTLRQAIRCTTIDGLDLLATGTLPPNPSELLLHERFALYLDEMTKSYDHILIDCPPVLAVTDPAIVGRMAGTSLLVVRAGSNSMHEIEQSVKRLKQAGVELRGLLLNGAKPASRRYSCSKYYKYAYQCSYEKK